MKFKVGDKVIVSIKEREIFCEVGTIVDIFNARYLINFENEVNGGLPYALHCIPEGHGLAVSEKYIEPLNIDVNEFIDDLKKYTTFVKGEWNDMNNFEEALRDLIEKEYNSVINKMFLEGYIEKLKENIMEQILKDYPDFKEMVDIKLTVFATGKGEEEIIKPARKKEEQSFMKLDKLIAEVKAQLSLAETYEQKIDVLVRYEILDKKTKKIAI